MPFSLDRRDFLRGSAVLGGSLLTCSIPLDRSVHAAAVRVDAPVVDELTVREITDNTHDIFLRGAKFPWSRSAANKVSPSASRQDAGKRMGAGAASRIPQGPGDTSLSSRLRFHTGCLRQQPRTPEDRCRPGGRADHQPWSLRSYRRSNGISGCAASQVA